MSFFGIQLAYNFKNKNIALPADEMDKDRTICFQTSEYINKALEELAAERKTSISSLIDYILQNHFSKNKTPDQPTHNRRRFERKKVDFAAFIGDSQWQRRDFEAITILDISIGGVRFSIPRGTKLTIKDGSELDQFIVIFRLPNYHWPISLQISPQRVSESDEDIQIGAALLNPDFCTYTALQNYLS